MRKKALITGITGQDGSYLADYLLNLGYEVHGIIRKASTFNTKRINHLIPLLNDNLKKFYLHYGDLSDYASLYAIMNSIKPDEVYNLGAQTHVKVSFDMPILTGAITGLATTSLLEAIRNSDHECRFYQASSSEMFGNSQPPQNENTNFYPRSPYAISKLYAYWMTVNYREAYGLKAFNGVLFNHESPRRGETFVTKKIISGLTNIILKKQEKLVLGNLDSKRDWGYAPEFVMGMHKMINYKTPDDFVLGTGQSITVKQFLEKSFLYAGLEYDKFIEIDERYFRPTEVDKLQADMTKASETLNWKPKVLVDDLIKIMVDDSFEKNNLEVIGEGKEILAKNNMAWVKEY